jgi:hypothetical protein
MLPGYYLYIIGGYAKWHWGEWYYVALWALWEITVSHMAYSRLPVMGYHFEDLSFCNVSAIIVLLLSCLFI